MSKRPKSKKKAKPRKIFLFSLSSYTFWVNFIGIMLVGLFAYAVSTNTVLTGQPFLLALFCGTLLGSLSTSPLAAVLAGFISVFLASMFVGSGLFATEGALSPFIIALAAGIFSSTAAVATTYIKGERLRQYLVYLLLLLIIVNFLYVSQNLIHRKIWPGGGGKRVSLIQMVSQEPPDEGYSIDTFYYLKIFYLMKAGANYYNAHAIAFDRDARRSGVPPEGVMGWRLPTVFWLWSKILPANGIYINYLFVLNSVLVLIGAFLLARRFLSPGAALLSPLLLSPYLLAGATTLWFIFAEYWAFFFGFFSLTLYLYRKITFRYPKLLTYLFAFLAAAAREHFLYFSLAGAISAFTYRSKQKWLWLLPIGGFLLFYFFHYLRVGPYYQGSSLQLAPWWGGGLSWLGTTIGFGTLFYPYKSIFPYLAIFMSFLGVLLIRVREDRLFLLLVLLIPFATFMIFGKKYSEYWGAVYMPFVFSLAPLAFQHIFPAKALDVVSRTPKKKGIPK